MVYSVHLKTKGLVTLSDKESMKTKETHLTKQALIDEKAPVPSKPKSLRPMRSMIAVRSLKPRTTVGQIAQSKVLIENTLN